MALSVTISIRIYPAQAFLSCTRHREDLREYISLTRDMSLGVVRRAPSVFNPVLAKAYWKDGRPEDA